MGVGTAGAPGAPPSVLMCVSLWSVCPTKRAQRSWISHTTAPASKARESPVASTACHDYLPTAVGVRGPLRPAPTVGGENSGPTLEDVRTQQWRMVWPASPERGRFGPEEGGLRTGTWAGQGEARGGKRSALLVKPARELPEQKGQA